MQSKLAARLDGLLEGTFTEECKTLVMDSYEHFLEAFITEDYFPFERTSLPTGECNRNAARTGGRVKAQDVRLVYLILMHEQAFQTQRLIDALDEGWPSADSGGGHGWHHFVVHVNGKPFSAGTQQEMLAFAATRPNVHVIEDVQKRMNVSWGGFNAVQDHVQATLCALQYILSEAFHPPS